MARASPRSRQGREPAPRERERRDLVRRPRLRRRLAGEAVRAAHPSGSTRRPRRAASVAHRRRRPAHPDRVAAVAGVSARRRRARGRGRPSTRSPSPKVSFSSLLSESPLPIADQEATGRDPRERVEGVAERGRRPQRRPGDERAERDRATSRPRPRRAATSLRARAGGWPSRANAEQVVVREDAVDAGRVGRPRHRERDLGIALNEARQRESELHRTHTPERSRLQVAGASGGADDAGLLAQHGWHDRRSPAGTPGPRCGPRTRAATA